MEFWCYGNSKFKVVFHKKPLVWLVCRFDSFSSPWKSNFHVWLCSVYLFHCLHRFTTLQKWLHLFINRILGIKRTPRTQFSHALLDFLIRGSSAAQVFGCFSCFFIFFHVSRDWEMCPLRSPNTYFSTGAYFCFLKFHWTFFLNFRVIINK